MDITPTSPASDKNLLRMYQSAVDMLVTLIDYAYLEDHAAFASASISTATSLDDARKTAASHEAIAACASTMVTLRENLTKAGIRRRTYEELITRRMLELQHYPWHEIRTVIESFRGVDPQAPYFLSAVDALQSAATSITMILAPYQTSQQTSTLQ